MDNTRCHRALSPIWHPAQQTAVAEAASPRPAAPVRADGPATPTIPQLRMLGQWRVEPDRRLVVEACEGADGVFTEVDRMVRNTLGDQQRDIPMLRRFYSIKCVDTVGITVTGSRGSGIEEIVMAPFVAPLTR